VLPDGLSAIPNSGTMAVAPGEKGVVDFVLRVPAAVATAYRRRAFTLDATIDGQHLGQLAEAVADLRPELDWGTAGEDPRGSRADDG